MNHIQHLIDTLCSNGIQYRKIGDVVDIKRGVRITKSHVKDAGPYPVISGGTKPMGYCEEFNRNEDTITIAQYGAAGYVDYQSAKFWANDVCYSIFPHDGLNNRFLYYVLKNNEALLYKLRTNAIPAHLPQNVLSNIEIPIPPLPIQEEIVRILDTFTELTAELTLRKKQYEFYRDKLLSFDDLSEEERERSLESQE